MFNLTYTGNNWYIFRSITEADLKAVYDNDLKTYFENMAAAVVNSAGDGHFYDDTFNVFTRKTEQPLDFGMLIHGEYLFFIIEMDKSGKITGNYARTKAEVEEERAVEAYLQWIGSWHVTDGYVGYDIDIESCENNYLYYVYGWETGSAVQEQMNLEDDWIFARYYNDGGRLAFFGQYIQTYEETFVENGKEVKTNVDEMFVGLYDSDDKVDEEGADNEYDIAHTEVDGEGHITLVPESFTINGNKVTYNKMQYTRYCYDNGSWAHYNASGIPSFPLSMTAVKASVHGPVVRNVSKSSIRRYQPKRAPARETAE